MNSGEGSFSLTKNLSFDAPLPWKNTGLFTLLCKGKDNTLDMNNGGCHHSKE